MTRPRIDLGGPGWELRGVLGLDAALRAAARPSDDEPGWWPARVPGSVLDDLWRAGEVPDPYVGRNSLAAEWVPQRAWRYRRRLSTQPLAHGERAWLRFEGVDAAGHVFLDGQRLASHAGMFVPFEVDVTARLTGGGDHRLEVVVEPAPESEPQAGRTSRVRRHKARMTYGWDFCPRVVHQGIWQPVSLEVAGPLRITDAWARPHLSADLRSARVEVRVVLDAARPLAARLEAAVDGPTVGLLPASAQADLPGGRSEVDLELFVRDPVPWWPNGAGQPALHRLTVRAMAGDEGLDERSVPLGFRRIELVPNEGAPDGARPYTFVVNGRRAWIRGWNWVPADALYGVPRPARLHHLTRLAADARVNLLRVWGGGLIETDAFYDACDARGLMVWQEFSQSSSLTDSTPAADPAFVELMRREAEAIVPLRRNHPSLAAWCGGNELEDRQGPLDETRSPVLAALRDTVRRLDPDRAWLPTSPSGPRFHNRLEDVRADPDGLHDVHGPWEHQGLRAQYELADGGTSLFHAEFGVEGMTNRRAHEALIEEADRWPPTRANPVYRHLGDWWINEPFVQSAFGERLGDLESIRRASQLLQAEGLRYAVEANRRRAPRQSGSIPWQLNESWPNAWGTAAVDHRGDPKPAYHAVARAYAPIVACAAFDGAAWGGRGPFAARLFAWSDHVAVADARLRARLVDLDGRELAACTASVSLEEGGVREVGRIEGPYRPLPALFLLDLVLAGADGRPLARNRYRFSGTGDFAALLDLAPARLEVGLAAGDDGWVVQLTHASGPAAIGLGLEDDRPIELPGWAEVADGGFDLLPGEERQVSVRWADAPVAGRRLRVAAWNVPGVTVAEA